MPSLLERDGQLALLAGLVERARAGSGALVLLAGDAGIGKTSLVRAVLERCDEGVARWLSGCEPLSVPSPLAPIRDLLFASGGIDADAEHTDRLALVRRLLGAVGASTPSIVVIEDIHWADTATLDIVRMLARRVEKSGVVVVVTYRGDEPAAHPDLALLLGDLVGRPAVQRITLEPLSRAGVRHLATGRNLDTDELARITGGNPLLVVESLAAPDQVPATVRDMVLARVRRLEPEARGLIDAAALVGQRVPLALLAQVSGGLRALDGCLGRGILLADSDAVTFRHELIRRAVEDSIAPVRRRELHARIVEALRGDPAVADAVLAHHSEAAGLEELALHYASAAARQADELGSQAEAARQYERALSHAPRGGAARVELLVSFGRSAWLAGRGSEAVDVLESAAAAAADLGDTTLQGRALNVLGGALWAVDRFADSRRVQEEAVALLAGSGDVAAHADALCGLVSLFSVGLDPHRALAEGPLARSLAIRSGRDDLCLDVDISLALAAGFTGDASRKGVFRAGVTTAKALRLTKQVIRCYVNACSVAAMNRDAATIDAVAPEALEFFDQLQVPHPRDDVAGSVARSMLDRGRLAEAVSWSIDARRTPNLERGPAAAVEALARLRAGDQSGATLLDEAFALASGSQDIARVPVVAAAAAEAAWLRGDLAAARTQLLAGLAVPGVEQSARASGDLVLWAHRTGAVRPDLARFGHLPEPVRREVDGDWIGARAAWQETQAPYEAAIAALGGDDRAAGEAVAELRLMGASATARAFARDRAARGRRAPRGPRRSTLANAAGLTDREGEVLAWVARGATNSDIAGALHLSERTVAHHVSAVLRKLRVSTRTAAVTRAAALGLLDQDGPARGVT